MQAPVKAGDLIALMEEQHLKLIYDDSEHTGQTGTNSTVDGCTRLCLVLIISIPLKLEYF